MVEQLLGVLDELESVYIAASDRQARLDCVSRDVDVLLNPWPMTKRDGRNGEAGVSAGVDVKQPSTGADEAARADAELLDTALARAQRMRQRSSSAKTGGRSASTQGRTAIAGHGRSQRNAATAGAPRARRASPQPRNAHKQVQRPDPSAWLQPPPGKRSQSASLHQRPATATAATSVASSKERHDKNAFTLAAKGNRLRMSRRFREAYSSYMTVRKQVLQDPTAIKAAQAFLDAVTSESAGTKVSPERLTAGLGRLSACLDAGMASLAKDSADDSDSTSGARQLVELCRMKSAVDVTMRGLEELTPVVHGVLAEGQGQELDDSVGQRHQDALAQPQHYTETDFEAHVSSARRMLSHPGSDTPWWLVGAEPVECAAQRQHPVPYDDIRLLHEQDGIAHQHQLCIVDQRLAEFANHLLTWLGEQDRDRGLTETDFALMFRLASSLKLRHAAKTPPTLVKLA